jgi:uncharacterized surface protein with fasciclin (FAS1) repeats
MRALFPLLLAIALPACSGEQEATAEQRRPAGSALEAADVVAAVRRLPEFATLTTALEATGVGAELARGETVTLLATRDTGFAELPPRTVPAMMAPAYTPTLRTALRQLALPRLLRAGELRTAIDAAGGSLSLPTLAGPPVIFTRQGEQIFVTFPGGARASMGTQDIGAGNGAVYVLDAWIGPVPPPLPEEPRAPVTPPAAVQE